MKHTIFLIVKLILSKMVVYVLFVWAVTRICTTVVQNSLSSHTRTLLSMKIKTKSWHCKNLNWEPNVNCCMALNFNSLGQPFLRSPYVSEEQNSLLSSISNFLGLWLLTDLYAILFIQINQSWSKFGQKTAYKQWLSWSYCLKN